MSCYAQSATRIGADHRRIVFSAGGRLCAAGVCRIICTMLKCPPRKAMPCALVASRVYLITLSMIGALASCPTPRCAHKVLDRMGS